MSSICDTKVSAIILAGGSGTRMRSDITKQKMLLGGISVLKRSVTAFEHCADIDEILVIVREDELEFAREELKDMKKVVGVGIGGSTRVESAERGFSMISDDVGYVAIHDAARPLVTPEMISEVISEAKRRGAATLASPVIDTIKIINNEGKIESTPRRSSLIRATTPQVFEKKIYSNALSSVVDKSDITDDNMLVERSGVDVYAVVCDRENPKLTSPSDILYMQMLLDAEESDE